MDALTTKEAAALEQCESVIEKGQQTFVEVGEAIARIRDERLYRATHKTFEQYCQERWGWTDRRARQLIDAAEVVKSLPPGENPGSGTRVPLLPDEKAARELKSVPVADRPKVLDKAAQASKGGKATAAAIKEAKAHVLPKAAYCKPVGGLSDDTDGPGGTEAPPARKPTNGAEVITPAMRREMASAWTKMTKLLARARLVDRLAPHMEAISAAIKGK